MGRIPTYEEVKDYLDSEDEYKKLKLIWKLMDSPGYDSTQFNYWADLLRLSDTLPGSRSTRGGTSYIEWVREQIRHNTPYDEFVTQLLTSSGDMWQSGDGASGFYRRDYGMELDHFALTMQVFSGIQMQCAQCHNHPFEKWTQKQFFEMAGFLKLPKQAYSSNIAYDNKTINKELNQKLNPDEKRYVQRYLRRHIDWVVGEHIPAEGKGFINLPNNYDYQDGSPNQRIQPRTVFGKEIKFSPSKFKGGPREVFADWLTSPSHPYFTRVIANRLWKKTMGIGFYEPVDDWRPDTKPSNEQLLKFLEKQMVYFKYDIKVFLAMLYSTDLFQRESTTYEYSDLETYHFPGPVIVRMTAEQVWDSLMTLKVANLDSYVKPPELGRYQEYETISNMEQDEVINFLIKHAKGQSPTSDDYSGVMMASLKTGKTNQKVDFSSGSMMNGGMSMMRMSRRGGNKLVPAAYSKLSENPSALKTFEEAATFIAQYEAERDYKKLKAVREKLDKKGSEYGFSVAESNIAIRYILSKRPDIKSSAFVRASELGSPAPKGHLLRSFGASDRIYLGNESTLPNAPQTLELMNGFVYKNIIDDMNSVIQKSLREVETLDEKLERLFLTVLCRPPNDEEILEMKTLVNNSDRGQIDGAIWTLLNSLEFLFVL